MYGVQINTSLVMIGMDIGSNEVLPILAFDASVMNLESIMRSIEVDRAEWSDIKRENTELRIGWLLERPYRLQP